MRIERYVYPDDLYYDRHHAYARVEVDEVVQGLTHLGQHLLGEAFFVELPCVGRQVRQGELLFSVQPLDSRKPVQRIRTTVSGRVSAVNAALEQAPEAVNTAPYDEGWVVRIAPADPLELQGELDCLMRACDPSLSKWARGELALERMRCPDPCPDPARIDAGEYDFPAGFHFDHSHAYLRVEGDLVVEGLTDLGQELLREALFVELPYVGRKVKQGDRLFSVQPMDARGRVRHICAAVSGEVVAVNAKLEDSPDWVNRDPYGAGWVVQLRPSEQLKTELTRLMRAAEPEMLKWVETVLEAEGLRQSLPRRTSTVPATRPSLSELIPVAPLRLGDVPLVNGHKTSQQELRVAGFEFPQDMYYDLSHAYARVEEDLVIEGITELAQGMLSEVLFVELPAAGRRVRQGENLFSVQSMERDRPVRRINAVVSGQVVEVNEALAENPSLINRDPYGAGWVVKLMPAGDLTADLNSLWQFDHDELMQWAWEELERGVPPLEFLRLTMAGRVTDSEMERMTYSRDLAPVPDLLVTPLGIRAKPDLIVRPINGREVATVVRQASRERIPITPRASASTVYFNTVPYRGGILLDLSGVRAEPELNSERGTVTVTAAMRWAELDAWLRDRGWAVLSYPTSAPTATVGGWFSMEGYGIGSLIFGSVHEQIVSASVVLPDGQSIQVTRDSNPPLEWFAGTEGTMGILTEMELRVRPSPEAESHHLLLFSSFADMRQAAVELTRQEVRPYSMHYSGPSYHRLLEQAGYSSPGDLPALEVDFEGTPAEVSQAVRTLQEIVRQAGGVEQPDEAAHAEWEERFRSLRAKRSGPSVLAAEIWLPLDRLDGFVHDVERLGRQMGVEFHNYGYVVAPNAALAFAMYRSDETRTLEYVMSLSVTKRLHDIGRRHGGHPYGVGLWNTPYLADIFTREQIEEMRRRKAAQDPLNILNPGKLYRTLPLLPPLVFKLGLSALSVVAGLRTRLRRALGALNVRPQPAQTERPVASAVKASKASLVQTGPVYSGVANEALICAQCGYCRPVCPVYDVLGWETTAPRGKIAVAKNLHLGNGGGSGMPDELIQRLYECTLCGRCKEVCPTGIDTRQLWLDMREMAGPTDVAATAFGRLGQCVADKCNITCESGSARMLWTQRLDTVPEGLVGQQGAEWLYFSGCVASLFPMVNGIPRAFVQILDRAGLSFTMLGEDECCCGYPLLAAGKREQARAAALSNLAHVRALGVQKIVTSCPSCYHTWKHDYPELTGEPLPFEMWHSTELLAEMVAGEAFPLRYSGGLVTYHDPCDLGRTSGIFDAPRQILTGIEGLQLVEMSNNREDAICCGGGGNLEMVDSSLVAEIGRRKMGLALDTDAQMIVSACQQCERTMTAAARSTKTRVRVKDITEVVWDSIQAAS